MINIACSRQRLRGPAKIVALVVGLAAAAPVAAQEVLLDPYGQPGRSGPDAPSPSDAPMEPHASPGRVDPYAEACRECTEPQPSYPQPIYPQPVYRPAPPAFEPRRTRPRTSPLLGAGLGVFTGFWALSSLAAAATDRGYLAIPLAGPIVELVHLDRTYGPSFGRTLVGGILVFDTVAQTAGVIMAICGGMRHRHVAPQQRTVSWGGAGVVGRF